MTLGVSELGCIDLDFGSFSGWWSAHVASLLRKEDGGTSHVNPTYLCPRPAWVTLKLVFYLAFCVLYNIKDQNLQSALRTSS